MKTISQLPLDRSTDTEHCSVNSYQISYFLAQHQSQILISSGFRFRTHFYMEFYLIISIVGVISLAMVICIYIRICISACKARKPPKFEEVPVTGHPSGLSVIPVFNYRYSLRSESTVLKLREKSFSWSGDDCTVKVLISVLRLCTFLIRVTKHIL